MNLNVKRRIRSDCKRWSKEDKLLLLDIILQDPITFEKPTANIYYNKIIDSYSIFNSYGWKALRDKMRNLRLNYTKAIDWRSNTGTGIDTEDAEKTIKDNMLKMCEDFEALDILFGQKAKIQRPYILESNNLEETSFVETPTEAESGYYYTESPEACGSPTAAGAKRKRNRSLMHFSEIQQEKTSYLKKKLAFQMTLEEKKLQLEERKLNLENRKFEEEFKIRLLENQQNFDIQKMKLENEMSLNKLRLEKEIALKELELKLKYNKE